MVVVHFFYEKWIKTHQRLVILLLNLIFIKTCRNVNNQVAKQKDHILTNVTNNTLETLR